MQSASKKRKDAVRAALAGFQPVLPLRLVLEGVPRTKKNSLTRRMVGGFNKTLPSEAWMSWRNQVAPKLTSQLIRGRIGSIAQPVNCAALFYRDANRGDTCGFYQGLADLLEEAGVLVDDKFITQWDGARLLKDSTRPRVELVLTPIGD